MSDLIFAQDISEFFSNNGFFFLKKAIKTYKQALNQEKGKDKWLLSDYPEQGLKINLSIGWLSRTPECL